MNPSKRKWLARLEQAAKAKEVKIVEQPVQPVAQVVVEQPVAQEVVETPAAVEEAVAPIMPSKKKKS